ncbi:MAG: pyruvate kinase, partial [Elusimicrobia bacterium]|nr:pyruvate kinase [Elusimicrobiota bacterium]
SDVANAIYDGADVVMLSGETAVGLYPVAAVKVMSDIIRKAEASAFAYRGAPEGLVDDPERGGHAHALAKAARASQDESHAKAICVFTLTGWSARIMSKYRPPVPIFALTPDRRVYEQLSLQWGILPLIAPLDKTTDRMIVRGERFVLSQGLLKRGDIVLVTAGGSARHRASNMLKILPLGSYS